MQSKDHSHTGFMNTAIRDNEMISFNVGTWTKAMYNINLLNIGEHSHWYYEYGYSRQWND